MLTEINFTLKMLIMLPEKRSNGFYFQPRLGTTLTLNLESVTAIGHTDLENWELVIVLGKSACLVK